MNVLWKFLARADSSTTRHEESFAHPAGNMSQPKYLVRAHPLSRNVCRGSRLILTNEVLIRCCHHLRHQLQQPHPASYPRGSDGHCSANSVVGSGGRFHVVAIATGSRLWSTVQ